MPPQTTQICANCGTTNPQNRLYCDNCGNRLSKPANLPNEEKPASETPSTPPSRQGFILPSRRPGDTGELDPDDLPEWLKTGERPGAEPDPERQSRITDWLQELTELTKDADQDRFTIDYGFLERPKWPGRQSIPEKDDPTPPVEALPENLFQSLTNEDEPATTVTADWLADIVDLDEPDTAETSTAIPPNSGDKPTSPASLTPSPAPEDEWLTDIAEFKTTDDLNIDTLISADWLTDIPESDTTNDAAELPADDWLADLASLGRESPPTETSDWFPRWEGDAQEPVSPELTEEKQDDWLADLAPADEPPAETDWTTGTALAVEDWLAALDEPSETPPEAELFNWDKQTTSTDDRLSSQSGEETEDDAAANSWTETEDAAETALSSWLSDLETEEPTPPARHSMSDWLIEDTTNLPADAPQTIDNNDTADFAASAEASVADWLADWSDESVPASSNEKSTDFAWDGGAISLTSPQQEPVAEEQELAPENFDLTSWLQELETATGEDDVEMVAATHLVENDLPEWLTDAPVTADEMAFALLDDSSTPEESSEERLQATETPDWLSELRAPDTTFFAQSTEALPPPATTSTSDELPDWMDDLMAETLVAPSVPDTPVPDWVIPEEEKLPPPVEKPIRRPETTTDRRDTPQELVRAELPDWLQQSLSEGSIATTSGQPSSLSDLSMPQDDLPDWLAAQPGEQDFSSALEAALSVQDSARVSGSFSSEWNDILGDLPPGEETIDLEEGNLPEWIQELKPRELTGLGPEPVEETEELTGPLTGMRNVIPIEPVIAQPKSNVAAAAPYTLTKEHQQQAALLHQLVHAEPQIITRMGQKHQAMSLVTRLILTSLLLAAVGLGLVLPWFDVSLPLTLPAPLPGVEAAQQTIAAASGTTALIAFEYTPGMAGELDPQANLILNQLAASGKELVAVSQYSAGIGQANSLGIPFASTQFVAGETIGLRSLAGCLNTNETCVGPFDLPASFTPKQVGLIVVLTSDRASLLGWIEQIAAQTNIPMVIGTTQGLAPVAQPYLESGQIAGLIPGLPGAAAYEQAISGQVGTIGNQHQAQTLAQLLVVGIFIFGALYYGFTGMRQKQSTV